MATVRHLGLLPLNKCPATSGNLQWYQLKNLETEEMMTAIWRVQYFELQLSATITSVFGGFDEDGNPVFEYVSHPININNEKLVLPYDQETKLVCASDQVRRYEKQETGRSVELLSYVYFDPAAEIVYQNKNWNLPFFFSGSVPSDDAVLDGETWRPVLTFSTEDLWPFDVPFFEFDLTLLGRTYPMRIYYVWTDPQDPSPGPAPDGSPFVINQITAEIISLSLTAKYWPYDPNDGSGPIYDKTTGQQLRPFPA